VEPTRFQKDMKAKEQLAEKHINRIWEKELRPIARDRRKWKELVDNLCS
jgi:DNA topoisomerase IA